MLLGVQAIDRSGLTFFCMVNAQPQGASSQRSRVVLSCGALLYLVAYLATTHVEPQGQGGLSGPVNVRMFRSESHLVAFYPLYLVERWSRNGSFTYCAYRFNCDFADRTYVHHWLYGDGKYSRVWYEDWQVTLGFLAVSVALGFALWKKSSCKPWQAAVVGLLCGFASVSALYSKWALRSVEWNAMTLKERHGGGPVLEQRMADPGGGSFYGTRSATSRGGGGGVSGSGEGDYSFGDEVVAITTNSFRMIFRLKRPGKPDERVLIVFPFSEVTETNWNGWHIRGKVF